MAGDSIEGNASVRAEVSRSATVEALDRWVRAFGLKFLASYAVWFAFLAALWATGFPLWRIAGVAIVPVSYAVTQLCRDRCGRWIVNDSGRIALSMVAVGLSGGMRSPLLVELAVVTIWWIIGTGYDRKARIRMAMFVMGGGFVAVAPSSWFGPAWPPTSWGLWTFAFLTNTILVTADRLAFFSDALDRAVLEAVHSREALAAAALSRTRELEVISSKLSHELKNPLGAIKTIVQVSARNARDPDLREQLEIVDAEVDRMRDTCKGYLSFSRCTITLDAQPVALEGIVDGALAVLEEHARARGVTVQRRGRATVRCDSKRLRDAILNLVINGIEATATSTGGKVEVVLAEEAADTIVSVRDSGAGMTPEVLRRIGTPFYTTRAHGTGLGVLIARSIFAQHGGTLVYDSAPGRGTVAVGRIPPAPRLQLRSVPHGDEPGMVAKHIGPVGAGLAGTADVTLP